MLRGDAATAASYADVVAAYAAGPASRRRAGLVGDGRPRTRPRPRADRAWTSRLGVADDAATPADPEATATVALLTAIHWYGRLDAAATVHWCERALAAIASASISSANSLRAVTITYLVHGLGYAGRTAESIAAAESASELPGDDGQLWLNPRSARGLLRPGRRRTRRRPSRSGVGRERGVTARHPEHGGVQLRLSGARRMGGRRSGTTRCCTPSARWRSTSSPTSASCSRR